MQISLLASYAKRGALEGDVRAALALFDGAEEPDVILWYTVIDAHARACRLDNAVVLFRWMASVLKTFDLTTMVVMLSGAPHAGELVLGMALHGAAVKRRLDTDMNRQNALVDMYAMWCVCSLQRLCSGL